MKHNNGFFTASGFIARRQYIKNLVITWVLLVIGIFLLILSYKSKGSTLNFFILPVASSSLVWIFLVSKMLGIRRIRAFVGTKILKSSHGIFLFLALILPGLGLSTQLILCFLADHEDLKDKPRVKSIVFRNEVARFCGLVVTLTLLTNYLPLSLMGLFVDKRGNELPVRLTEKPLCYYQMAQNESLKNSEKLNLRIYSIDGEREFGCQVNENQKFREYECQDLEKTVTIDYEKVYLGWKQCFLYPEAGLKIEEGELRVKD